MDLQEKVKALSTIYKGEVITYDSVCNKPVKGYGCIVQSPLAYWQNNPETFSLYKTDQEVRDKLAECTIEIV